MSAVTVCSYGGGRGARVHILPASGFSHSLPSIASNIDRAEHS